MISWWICGEHFYLFGFSCCFIHFFFLSSILSSYTYSFIFLFSLSLRLCFIIKNLIYKDVNPYFSHAPSVSMSSGSCRSELGSTVSGSASPFPSIELIYKYQVLDVTLWTKIYSWGGRGLTTRVVRLAQWTKSRVSRVLPRPQASARMPPFTGDFSCSSIQCTPVACHGLIEIFDEVPLVLVENGLVEFIMAITIVKNATNSSITWSNGWRLHNLPELRKFFLAALSATAGATEDGSILTGEEV